jgi:hypothetical protein
MSSNSAIQQAVELVAVPMPSPKAIVHNPVAAPKASSSKAALRRCCAAWQRAFDANLHANEFRATKEASAAYCKAMPLLEGEDGLRDFIACAAHGIVIGAIPEKKGGQLFYAAQVALATLRRERKPSGPAE